MNPDKIITVFGASGTQGNTVAKRLLQEGWQIRLEVELSSLTLVVGLHSVIGYDSTLRLFVGVKRYLDFRLS